MAAGICGARVFPIRTNCPQLRGNREPRLSFQFAGCAIAPQIEGSYMFTAAKDVLASKAAQTWANSLIARYGNVQGLKINSRLKSLEVSCLLDGEPTPIT